MPPAGDRSDMTRARRWPLVLALLPLALSLSTQAQAQAPSPTPAAKPRPGKQEESRRKLLDQVGIERRPRAPAPPADAAPPEPEPAPAPPSAASDPAAAAPGAAAPAAAAPEVVPFTGRVHQALLGSCRVCHAAGAMAATTRLILDGNATHDHAAARRLADLRAPRRSLLLTKATGTAHGGGPTITTTSDTYRRLLQWISTGAELAARPAAEGAAPAAAAAPPSSPAERRPRPRLRTPVAAPVPVPVPIPAVGAPGDPAAPAEAPASDGAAAPAATTAEQPGAPPAAAAALSPTAVTVHQELQRACLLCHRAGGPAAMTRYKLSGALEPDLTASRAFVDAAAPAGSALVTKAAGQAHGGGAPWPPGSAGHKAVLAWIEAGAPDRAPAPTTTDSPAAAVEASPIAVGPAQAAAASAPGLAPPAPTSLPGAPAGHARRSLGVNLFGNQLTLNGRFDVNFERRNFDANPWGDGSATALQSYHHFLFLGRQAADDPFVFTAELTSLEFYEAGFRLGRGRRGWGAHVRAGKLLVPFGNEPLFHQSYGGHVGFDQRVLPAVWAAEGLAASGHLEVGGATLSGDLYGVRGHALRRPDAVLSLQADLSPVDDAHPALGTRLGAAFGALGGFYSAYFNPLGHDRRLFMQALDVSLWRWRGIPVVDRLVLGAGALRADVSGGGAGADYYHFASYWLARVYALDWLYLQYRQGLRTFDNKRNLTFDRRRQGREDGSTHNFALATRYRGLSAGLTYFLNFEKADEVDDDLLRLWVAFEF